MLGLQGLAEAAGEDGHLSRVEGRGDLFPPEQAVYAAGQGRPGVLPGCQAGHCGGQVKVGSLLAPYLSQELGQAT